MSIKNVLGKLFSREKQVSKDGSADDQETLDRLWWFMTKLPDWSWVMKSYGQETKITDFWLTESVGGAIFARLWKNWFILSSPETFYILDYINRAKKIAVEQMTNGDESTKISWVKFEYNEKFPEKWPTVVVSIENVFDEDEELWDEYEAGYWKAIPIIEDKLLNKIPEWKLIKEHANEIITYLNKWAMENFIYDIPIAKDFA